MSNHFECMPIVQNETSCEGSDHACWAWWWLEELWCSWHWWRTVLLWCKLIGLALNPFHCLMTYSCVFVLESGCFFLWNGCPLRQNRDHQCIRRNVPARRIQLNPWLVAQGWEDQAAACYLQTLLPLSLVHIAHNFWRQCWVDRWHWGLHASLPRMLPFQDLGAGAKTGEAWGVRGHVWRRARSKHSEEQP